ncbi:His Kinase A (phospho-acceptor) domain-containing protein [Desulfocicer vacuolatum DSM 3385]|uniref:histidine kinase n=1 Tax=Desulfocicer vacuolatum DSM 3385 TaxID=1121400 RepID=A0A1W2DR56_9BACT|nr:response regulator [Desulfocicer vacuolatum]SMC99608.1 His Kinase A (phospho-acceptor) domain-containing protein [Desulfocicer vacuolatum DSM 3385]
MTTHAGDKIRLLLVDDEEGFRAAIARRLAKRGMAPAQASSGEECLTLLDTSPMDVVVLDVRMPGMNGIDTLKAIKTNHKDIQVILLTGNAAVSDGIEGIKSGAFDYLTKPVEIDHLFNKIKQAFGMIQLEEEKRQQLAYREKLEKKMVDTDRLAALGTLSTGIAHEINNPLAIINEAAGVIKQILEAPDMAQLPRQGDLLMALDKIETSIKRAGKITQQLLGHVKKQGPRLATTDMRLLILETLALLKGGIKKKQINILWKTEEKEHMLITDPYQIRQVLVNLITNAIHALDTNGTISLSIHETPAYMILGIEDDGVGISSDNLGKIFDPFFTTKSFDQGTGLGLFVVNKIITGLNGEIEVESHPGQGTVFMIKLPLNSGGMAQ